VRDRLGAATPAPGLSTAQARDRLAARGRNELPHGTRVTAVAAILGQLTDAVILVLLAAALLTAATGDLADTAVILAVVVLNTALGAGQEIRSARAMAALEDLTAPRAIVVRDGVAEDIDAREVVVGDLIDVRAGDIVAGDAVLLDCTALQVDESMLTGESVPVAKLAGEHISAGTVVTRGRGRATVQATGFQTALGGIVHSVRGRRQSLTPLQRQLSTLGGRLALAAALAALAVGAVTLAGGRSLETSAILAISLAVAAIPESLPAVVSVSLALSARRLTRRGILTRKLAAVEALGSITVLGSDKTGTLTEGRMKVVQTWTPPGAARRELLEAAALCNDALPGADAANKGRHDPTEVALVAEAAAEGIDVAVLRATRPRVAEVPFEAQTCRMQTTHAVGTAAIDYTKGAPEAVLSLVPAVLAADAASVADDFAAQGMRVLAVASRALNEWRLLGLLALHDPPRPQARMLVRAFRRAGVRPIMITGDHLATARSVAQSVGISQADTYARVRPAEKTAIIAALQGTGEIVAMTGDGVNDAPALRQADVGIAMGGRGTEVAKQAADLILTSDDLSAMVGGITEGRRIYDNVRRFLHYALAGGVAEILIMLCGPLVGFTVPLRAGQILWVNLLTHGLPGVAMGNEPAASDVTSRPPRGLHDQLLHGRLARRVLLLGSIVAGGCLVLALAAERAGRPWQSMLFLALVFAQLTIALALRPRHVRWRDNIALPATVALNIALAIAAVAWAPLRDVLRLQAVTWTELLLALLPAALAGIAARLQNRGRPRLPDAGFRRQVERHLAEQAPPDRPAAARVGGR
jgi:Ca2+-transporting ATPase